MIRRIPILPTLLVLAAVGVMIRLGLWQLDRLHEKQALLAQHAAAASVSVEVPWSEVSGRGAAMLYRRSRVNCGEVSAILPMAGQNAAGEAGIAHVADCALAGGSQARIVLGWSRDPGSRDWRGGEVAGIIAPGGKASPRLVADPPLAGLQPNARPDPSSIPNNHLSYAVQWFLFAAVALVIYALALWKRLAVSGSRG